MSKRIKYGTFLRRCVLMCMLTIVSGAACAAEDDEILEFLGDRYVIHVDRMQPDSEMTLLDVLNTCPEFLSINGKTIDLEYSLRVDNIDVAVDRESFLSNVKACEVDRIQICNNSSVAKAVGGIKGVIDIYYREDIKTDGKVSLAGSTYGNGMLYADITNRSEKLTVQGYAMARTSYGKAYPNDLYRMTDRGLTESVHLNLDWKISKSDRLYIKAFQVYDEAKQKFYNPDFLGSQPLSSRYIDIVLSYAHTFKNDAVFIAEAGSDYNRSHYYALKEGDTYPYAFVEFDTPLFTPDLWLMVGVEMDYANTCNVGRNREQGLVTDFYGQLDYTHGPWVITLGDRFRMMNMWNRQYDTQNQELWSHGRNNHCYLGSVGYKAGRNFFQGLVARRFYIPEVSDFLVEDMSSEATLKFDASGYKTNLVHQGVLRYSYQHKNFSLHSSVEGDWYTHLPGPNMFEIGIRNSAYWRVGQLELTLGANYYHRHINSSHSSDAKNEDYVTLKLAPVLNLPHGFRLSSTLLYISKRAITDDHAHLFATVKVNKQWGRKCNVFAEFHDIAGYATGSWMQLMGLYQNRALTIGATVYPFR